MGPGKAPLPTQGLAEYHHIAEISSITTLTSSQNTGAEILANKSFETRILLKYGKNNIIKGPSKESHPSQEVVNQKKGQYIETPGVLNIMKFAIPAVGVLLCEPLLSLIDTSLGPFLWSVIPDYWKIITVYGIFLLNSYYGPEELKIVTNRS